MSGGELITKPLTFTGTKLHLNFATSAAGSIRVEILDAEGNPIPDYSLADSCEVFGDTVDRVATWKNGGDVSVLAGRTVQLRFVLNDADLYALRFGE